MGMARVVPEVHKLTENLHISMVSSIITHESRKTNFCSRPILVCHSVRLRREDTSNFPHYIDDDPSNRAVVFLADIKSDICFY
jgi:hypothetical protein